MSLGISDGKADSQKSMGGNVAWECAECSAKEEGVRTIVVCHHCGKPVCRAHSVVIVDDAFAVSDPPGSRRAVHCSDCKSRYHPRGSDIEPEAAGLTSP